MNLTVEQLMAQVIRFLESGQPNMASLYMKKALGILHKERVTAGVKSILDVLEEMFAPIVEFIRGTIERVAAVVRDCYQLTKSDFALVSGL